MTGSVLFERIASENPRLTRQLGEELQTRMVMPSNIVPFPAMAELSGDPSEPARGVPGSADLVRAQEALRTTEMQLDLVAESVPALIVYFDKDFICRFANSQYANFFGYTRAGILGKQIAEVIGDDVFEDICSYLVQVLAGQSVTYERTTRSRDGTLRCMHVSFAPELDASGLVKGTYALMTDITHIKAAEDAARKHAMQQEAVAVFGQYALESRDLENLIANAAAMITSGLNIEHSAVFRLAQDNERLLLVAGVGWPKDDLGNATVSAEPGSAGRSVLDSAQPVIHADVRVRATRTEPSFSDAHGLASSIEVSVPTSHRAFGLIGAYRREAKAFSREDANFMKSIANALGAAIDRKTAEERVAHVAQFDAVTGLPNRTLFRDRLAHAIARARRKHALLGVIFFDLDRFKEINDTLGHRAGDRLLRSIGKRLQGALRAGDTVARLGGDEFTVLLEDLYTPEQAATIGHKVLAALAKPFTLEGQEFFVTASAGLTVYPLDSGNVENLLQNADIAMYQAKDNGKNNLQIYSPEMNALKRERMTLESQLRRAIERNELYLEYQPQVDLATGAVSGFEALVRWRHPQLGAVAPSRFIPLAEKSALILAIGGWVLRTACTQAMLWRSQGGSPFKLSVNVSPRQFRSDLFQTIADILQDTGFPPQWLELELTESLLMDDPEAARLVLDKLKRLGVHIAIDDFGSGYSSLSYIKQFPIDCLKIDQSFVRDLGTDPNDAAIAKAVIALGHALGLQVVAEGVETDGQLAFLREHACDFIQGHYYSPPVGPEHVLRLVRELSGELRPSGRPARDPGLA